MSSAYCFEFDIVVSLFTNTTLFRVMTVSLTRYRTDQVLPAFFDLVSALPNLHTIEFVHVHSQMATAIALATQGKIFPSIHKLIMPTCAYELLNCTPNIEDITCNEDKGGLITTGIRMGKCVKLTRLAGVKLTHVTIKSKSTTFFSLTHV